MSRIDIRIMGVPERLSYIKSLKSILGTPSDKIIIDTEHLGVIPTAKRAWLLPTDKEYTMVLNDDVLLCDGFLEICERIVVAMPNAIISLFPIQFQSSTSIRTGCKPTVSPYVAADVLSGVGIIMPTKYARPCIESWVPNAKCDDRSIEQWAKKNRIPIITTLPAILQHIGDLSFFNPGRLPIKTDFFEKNPVADWDNTYVTSWTSLIR